MVGSIAKYSAIPPHTPQSFLVEIEKLNNKNGYDFFLSVLFPIGVCFFQLACGLKLPLRNDLDAQGRKNIEKFI